MRPEPHVVSPLTAVVSASITAMSAPARLDVLLIGTGRAAFHLGHALLRAGVPVVGVMGRDAERTATLASRLGSVPVAWSTHPPAAAVTLLAVSDDAIAPVAVHVSERSGVVAHCAGTRSVDELLPHARRAVIWPVQALSIGEPLDLSAVPLVVDGSGPEAVSAIKTLAGAISGKVQVLGDDQRRRVHLAAAITSNLPVFLAAEARRLLQRDALPPDLLVPLWRTTAERAAELGPEQVLTGPARRGDLGTIRAHLALLEQDPDLRRVYALLSNMILRAHGHPRLEEQRP
jgi:predicted short-subunit dehydrogenase-like oxidoreductase (DUF2520 family)